MIASGTIITPDMKPAWLEQRQEIIGASEVAAVMGASPYQTPVETWCRKTGRIAPVEESEAMLWGSALEPVILAEYERRYGVTVGRRQEFHRHFVLPFLAATLDGVAGDDTLVEVKTTSAYARGFGDEEDDELPDHYRLQVHAQMAVTGLQRANLVVLIGGQKLKVYPVERHEPLVALIEDRVGEFWRCVETDTPPTWGRMTAADLAVVNPRCEGEIEGDGAILAKVAEYEACRSCAKSYEERGEALKAEILEAMGNASVARLPDGRKVKRYLEEVPARTVSYESKAYLKHYFRISKGDKR